MTEGGIVASVRAAVRGLDLEDVLVFGGLGVACYGIAQFSGPAACIVGGAACFWLGVRKP